MPGLAVLPTLCARAASCRGGRGEGAWHASYWLPRASIAAPIGCPGLPAVLRRKWRVGGGRWAAETLNGAGPGMEAAAAAGRQRALLRQVSAAQPRPFPSHPPLSSPRPPPIHAASPSGAGLEAGGRRRLVRAAAARLHRGLRPPQRHSAPAPAALALWYVPCPVCASPPSLSGFLSGGSS